VGDGTFEMNGTQLRLTAPSGASHNIWTEGNRSVRVMQSTEDVNFEIITKFESVVTQRYQMQGILIPPDRSNFLRLATHYDGTNVKLYVARFVNGNPTPLINDILLAATPGYLRITRVGSTWGFSYSHNGTTWTSGGSFTHDMVVRNAGVFAGNHGMTNIPA